MQCVENMLMCSELMESLVIPLQEQIDEWKKTAGHLDKEHAHGMLRNNFVWNVCPI